MRLSLATCDNTGDVKRLIQVRFPDRVEPGKVFVLLWAVQKGFLETANL